MKSFYRAAQTQSRRLLFFLLLAWCTGPSAQPGAASVKVDDDGTVHMPAQTVPISTFLSPEGQAYLTDHLLLMKRPEMLAQENGIPKLLVGYLERQRQLFPVKREDTNVGGVHAYVYTPSAGIAEKNRDKVLINLHGGGFSGCWPACAELESMPIASLGGIKVVSLDYRQGPKYKFPAASEDVAKAYRELLRTYRPENIGIYGCSAGGMLTGMAVAWFQQHDLPRPGAIGILCAGITRTSEAFGGDANYFTMPMGEGRMETLPNLSGSGLGYLAGTDSNDPLVAPVSDPEVLAKFPPSLFVTGTRSFELSNAVYSHIQMTKLGVSAEMYVWEGMFHGFFYNPDVPESQESFAIIVKFFDKWLGKF